MPAFPQFSFLIIFQNIDKNGFLSVHAMKSWIASTTLIIKTSKRPKAVIWVSAYIKRGVICVYFPVNAEHATATHVIIDAHIALCDACCKFQACRESSCKIGLLCRAHNLKKWCFFHTYYLFSFEHQKGGGSSYNLAKKWTYTWVLLTNHPGSLPLTLRCNYRRANETIVLATTYGRVADIVLLTLQIVIS